MKQYSLIPLFLCVLVVTFFGCTQRPQSVADSTEQVTYENPVIRIPAPDPTAIRTADGTYYLYATENIRNTPIFKSSDMVH